MNKFELENTALELYALLKALSGVDSDNKTALYDMPIALRPAAALAEKLYTEIAESTNK